MRRLDTRTATFEVAEIDDYTVLFSDVRLDRSTVPEGVFCYDVRDSDELDGSMAEIKSEVLVNYWGTILSRVPIDLDERGSYYPKEWGYLDELTTLKEWMDVPEEGVSLQEGDGTGPKQTMG